MGDEPSSLILFVHVLWWAFPDTFGHLRVLPLGNFVLDGHDLDLVPPVVSEVEPVAKCLICLQAKPLYPVSPGAHSTSPVPSLALVDWNGDGLDEIVIAEGRGLFDGHGSRLATFVMEAGDVTDPRAPDAAEMGVLVGDMTGDGIPDVLLTTRQSSAVYIYENKSGLRPTPPKPPGTEPNFTLY